MALSGKSPGRLNSISTGVFCIGFEICRLGLFEALLRAKFHESLILKKPDSLSPNLFRRAHLARRMSPIPRHSIATAPTTIPTMEAVVKLMGLLALAWVSAAAAGTVGWVVSLAVGLDATGSLGRLEDGDAEAVVELAPGGLTSVATMLEWVLGAASRIPAHMLYPVVIIGV